MHTIAEIIQEFRIKLKGLYPEREIDSILYILFDYELGYSKIDVSMNKEKELPQETQQKFSNFINQLTEYKPIQYVTGFADFMGMKLAVSPDVLIPRPETEELVEWIIDRENDLSGNILEIGTGSGCISIALVRDFPGIKITAIDISSNALKIAKKNADLNGVKINFRVENFMDESWKPAEKKYNLIVSNPPYVSQSEKSAMSPNVLEYEPHEALFVADEDPLIFYQKIAETGLEYLTPEGAIYVEINERFPTECYETFSDLGYSDVKLRKDIHGKYRMLRAEI